MSDAAPKKKKKCDQENGRPNAEELFQLGMNYSVGREVENDIVAAHKWFNLAAMMGHEEALSARAELAREMTQEQIAEAQRQARSWLWNQNSAPKDSENQEKSAPIRPLYVRRQAEAMRSAKAYFRVVA